VHLVLPFLESRVNRLKKQKKWQPFGNTLIQPIEKQEKQEKREHFFQTILYQPFTKQPNMKTATFSNNSTLLGNKFCFQSTELDTKPTKIMENHQGLYAGQRSSNVVHSGQHPFPLKLKGRGSFSLLLCFGEAKESKER